MYFMVTHEGRFCVLTSSESGCVSVHQHAPQYTRKAVDERGGVDTPTKKVAPTLHCTLCPPTHTSLV